MMRSRIGIVSALIGMLLGTLVGFAPAASAATNGCNNSLYNWKLQEKIKSDHHVIRNFYSSSHNLSCLIVRRDDGRKMNVQLIIERDFVKKGKATTTATPQFLGVKRVARVFNTNDVWISIEVFTSLASEDVLPYRGKTTLLRS